MIQPGDSCSVINNGDNPITIGWDNVPYKLMPHVPTIVPADAVINFFGDPRASSDMRHIKDLRGRDAWVVDRETENRRLAIKWGIGNLDKNGLPFEYPDVTVKTVTGETVTTVLQDPEGAGVNPADMTQQQQQTVFDLMAKMQAELDALRAQAGQQGTMVHEDELPRDDGSDTQDEPQQVIPKAAYDDIKDDDDDDGFGIPASR